VALGRNLRAGRRQELGEAVIVPAATDLHVHFREPGPDPDVETIATGTLGAALGGVGLVGEMPNTEPPVDSTEHLEGKAARVRGRAAVDVLLYALATTPGPIASLGRRAGAFKIYLSPTTGIESPPTSGELGELWSALARTRLPVAVHAEEPARFQQGTGALDPIGWDGRRPLSAESAAVAAVLRAPESVRLHIAHATSPVTVEAVRSRGVSCEATPQHLLLSSTTGRDARFKVNPPLRPEATREALWRAFGQGEVPMLASDHAPHSVAAKARPFDLAPSGVPGVQTSLPLLLARVAIGQLRLDVLQRAACDRPARFFGQPVGRLALGHRANLLAVDFRRRSPIRGDRLASPSGWSPFEGWEAVFPMVHWRDGERIVDGGESLGSATGAVVRPDFADPKNAPEG
jgi:dihydroorotase